MEFDIRTALMIISAIAILAILAHGLWKIRKNRNPYKLKAKASVDDFEANSSIDSSGFDQDGVGQVRVVGANALTGEIENPPEESEIPRQPAPAPDYNDEPIPQDLLLKEQVIAQEPELTENEQVQEEDIASVQPVVIESGIPEFSSEVAELNSEQVQTVSEAKVEATPVYQEPVSNPKPQRKVSEKPKARRNTRKKSTNQIEINFGDELPLGDDISEEKAAKKKQSLPEIEPEVIVFSVITPENQVISGAALLPCLLTLGMKFGEMDIFHRYQDNAGNGKATFSLANMMNPGTFDLDNMETFSTQGVSLFMTLPNVGDAFKVFEQMLAAAKHIAKEFNGQLLDDKRSVMTKQTEQHYVSKIREFERKYRIASGM